jgi:hypothetical protein
MTKTSDQEVIQADREVVDRIMCDDPDAPDFDYAYREVAAHRMTERAAIVAWLRAEARSNYNTAFECWKESRQTGDAGTGSIGDSAFHEYQIKDRIIDAIERGDHTETSHEQ